MDGVTGSELELLRITLRYFTVLVFKKPVRSPGFCQIRHTIYRVCHFTLLEVDGNFIACYVISSEREMSNVFNAE